MKKRKLNKQPTHNSNAEVETPYVRAKQAWDERIGSARVQASNWRLVAILALIVACILAIALIMTLNSQKNFVYVAQVSKSGQVVNVAPMQQYYQPTQAQEEYFIGNFIRKMRSLPLDPVVAKQNWVDAYHFLTQQGAIEFNKIMQQTKPQAQIGKQTVSVQIVAINPLSKNSYQVDWTETTVGSNGNVIGKTQYSGVFTLIIKTPTTQQQIMENPLGIYITHFDITTRDA